MNYLSLSAILRLHQLALRASGGAPGVRDLNALASAVAQPRMTFGGQELYSTLAEKAVALGYSLILNHPFVDGNKRVGHAALETMLVLNGFELNAPVDEQERVFLEVAAGVRKRPELLEWVKTALQKKAN